MASAARRSLRVVLASREISLSRGERDALEALVRALSGALGDRLRGVWLYGSRARGERTGPESDVDVLVLLDDLRPDDRVRVADLAWDAVEATGEGPAYFVPKTRDLAWLEERRAIGSFFVAEIDRDRVILAGDAR